MYDYSVLFIFFWVKCICLYLCMYTLYAHSDIAIAVFAYSVLVLLKYSLNLSIKNLIII